ncbi:uncharacterized protein LOC141891741 [Acropora palmata]|uniref:uncharacterized protein LOC141891741 n=1 Tax=Acropora palmata TaxID=6131 RepID=UPI003DA0C63E
MERSRTMENMKIGNGTVPHNGMYGNLGMERSRTMENMEIGNGTVPHNRKYGNLGMERSRTMENVENIGSLHVVLHNVSFIEHSEVNFKRPGYSSSSKALQKTGRKKKK